MKKRIQSNMVKIEKQAGDVDRLDFKSNILENYVGVELQELDEKTEPNLDTIKPDVSANPSQADSPQASQVANQPSRVEAIQEPRQSEHRYVGMTQQEADRILDNAHNVLVSERNEQAEQPPPNDDQRRLEEARLREEQEREEQIERYLKYTISYMLQITLFMLLFLVLISNPLSKAIAMMLSLLASFLIDFFLKMWHAFQAFKRRKENRKMKFRCAIEIATCVKNISLLIFTSLSMIKLQSHDIDGASRTTDPSFLGLSMTLLIYFVGILYFMISAGFCGNFIVGFRS